VPVLALETDPDTSAARVLDEIRQAQDQDDIQCVVLGCAGMSYIPGRASPDVTVRLIDGVRAAVHIGTSL
jgi:allantoin racemase